MARCIDMCDTSGIGRTASVAAQKSKGPTATTLECSHNIRESAIQLPPKTKKTQCEKGVTFSHVSGILLRSMPDVRW
jgi:hypothetical protein